VVIAQNTKIIRKTRDRARVWIDMNVEQRIPLQQYCVVLFSRGRVEGQVKTNARQFCIIAP